MNINEFRKIFGDCEIIGSKIYISSDIVNVLNFIQMNYHFDLLKEIIAVDHGNNQIELIYKLYSTENEENILIATMVEDKAMSVSKIYDSAVADEKEIYDLFGVMFIGNDELKRLYMPEGWEGHPLKKDYVQNDERLSWNEEI